MWFSYFLVCMAGYGLFLSLLSFFFLDFLVCFEVKMKERERERKMFLEVANVDSQGLLFLLPRLRCKDEKRVMTAKTHLPRPSPVLCFVTSPSPVKITSWVYN